MRTKRDRVLAAGAPASTRGVQISVRGRMAEAGRHHADDGVALVVERDRAPDDAGIGAEAPPPERIAQNHHVVVAGPRVFGPERPPEPRRAPRATLKKSPENR